MEKLALESRDSDDRHIPARRARIRSLERWTEFKFTEAISFYVHCESQEEVDYFWEKLTAGGEEGPCGWLKDKFGVSWQIVPNVIG